jgi:threonyl-tRNA synthetase
MSDEITVTLPDGTSRRVTRGTTPAEVAASIGKGLAKAALAARVDGEWVDLDRPLASDATLSIVVPASDEGREVLRHSTAHVMAQAVVRLFPGALYAIGPAIADGFYYDFALPDGRTFRDDDLPRIEQEMRAIVKADEAFVRRELSYDDALQLFAGQQYKREIIEKVRSGDASAEDAGEAGGESGVSVYENTVDGEVVFADLCRGPHVPSTGRLGVFKLTKLAGAYWRGDEKGPMLQRIYGTAWESKPALDEHLHRLEEAERRDHRKLGVELDLFSFPEEIGSGLAVFHPKGALVRRIMEEYSRQRHEESGYDFVNSPHITKEALFQISGHLDWFADGMFPPMHLDETGPGHEGTKYYLKPMNCPFHILIFRHRMRSYRELPLRFFEFGSVYRYEKSGVVHGLTRVRGMTQDDAHIFCTKEQMPAELSSLLDFVLDLLRDYGLSDFYLELSTKPPGKAVGTDEEWEEATEFLRVAASGKGLDLVLDEGGGAFYGPKISVQAKDAIGRTWQMSTIQVDFQLPQRFDLTYVGPDNERHRPVMIHRALFGSIERFFGVLVEHYAGAFPAWLAPVQAAVLPVSDRHDAYAFLIVYRFRE